MILGADLFSDAVDSNTREASPTMNRAIRERLVGLLVQSFQDPRSGDVLLCLSLYWELLADERRDGVALRDLEAAWRVRYPHRVAKASDRPAAASALRGILTLRRCAGAATLSGTGSAGQRGGELLIEPHPATLPFLDALRERTRMYARVVQEAANRRRVLVRLAPLDRAVAEAALCFNAGLFFEAHEHLEHHWVRLPRGPVKRFVQGLIQIAVGYHHARRGSYEGAVNQLEKGLAKLAEAPGDALGLDVDRLRRETAAVRNRIVARGRSGMRQATLDELPRMSLRM